MKLPPKQRAAVILTTYDGLTHAEAAARWVARKRRSPGACLPRGPNSSASSRANSNAGPANE